MDLLQWIQLISLVVTGLVALTSLGGWASRRTRLRSREETLRVLLGSAAPDQEGLVEPLHRRAAGELFADVQVQRNPWRTLCGFLVIVFTAATGFLWARSVTSNGLGLWRALKDVGDGSPLGVLLMLFLGWFMLVSASREHVYSHYERDLVAIGYAWGVAVQPTKWREAVHWSSAWAPIVTASAVQTFALGQGYAFGGGPVGPFLMVVGLVSAVCASVSLACAWESRDHRRSLRTAVESGYRAEAEAREKAAAAITVTALPPVVPSTAGSGCSMLRRLVRGRVDDGSPVAKRH